MPVPLTLSFISELGQLFHIRYNLVTTVGY